MKCPGCQFENPKTAKFCVECGGKLEILCPDCGFSNLSSFKFCGECGHNLTLIEEPAPKELSFDEKIEKIQRYLPKGLTEKILSQKDRIEGERKHVTVMFCDMEGFTHLSEKLGPEEAYSVMDQVYEILIHKVHDYDGTVNEMTGDGIMALFGAPIAMEGAPQRAIQSSFAIHREMAKYSDKLKQSKNEIPPLKMRIGLHTGTVVVGALGNDLRVEFKAVGDTVNLASRMEGLAEPGSTYVTYETFKLTEGFFRFEALGPKKVKGKQTPVKVYQVIAPSGRRTRFDVSAERGLTPFVGRERELELMIEGYERANGGNGQTFSIIGEAGTGKSRFLYEFRKAVSKKELTFLEGKCISYGKFSAYHPIVDILKGNFEIGDNDSDAEIRAKVTRSVQALGADETKTLPYLLELLSVKDSGIDKIPLSPAGRSDRIIDALNRIVIMGSEIRPLILAVEDLHWTDQPSEEALKSLLEVIPGSRVMVILTYRPEYDPAWKGRSYQNQLTLNRFSSRESLAIASHLLGTEEIGADVKRLVLEKTEGVPFFIEEFVKSLRDLKIIDTKDGKYFLPKDIQTLAIPSTIQDVIMARIDSLTEAAKRLLQFGSVIAREFSYELIEQVTGLSEHELLSQLSMLRDAELLYERGIYPQSTYIFKHALTQEVVYGSILTNRKNEIHEKIGTAIETLYQENINEYYEALAEHFIKSDNFDKGAIYSKLASKKTLKTASPYDAIYFTEKEIHCLESLPQTADIEKRTINARIRLGLYYTQINYHVPAKEVIDPIIDLVNKRGYRKRLAHILIIDGAHKYMVEEDFQVAFDYFNKALSISNEQNDIISFAQEKYWLALAQSLDCQFKSALSNFNEVLNVNIAVNNLWGISTLKSVISYFVYYLNGEINLSFDTSKEAVMVAEESADIYSKAMANVGYGVACYGKGLFEEAIRHLGEGANLCDRINVFSWNAMAQCGLAETYFEIGRYEESMNHYCSAAKLIEKNSFLDSWRNFCEIGIVRGKVKNHKSENYVKGLEIIASKNKVKIWQGWLERYIGEIFLILEDDYLPKAEHWIIKAANSDRMNKMMFHLGLDYALHAQLFFRKNEKEKAQKYLEKAKEIFKQCGADGWVKKYEKEMATL